MELLAHLALVFLSAAVLADQIRRLCREKTAHKKRRHSK